MKDDDDCTFGCDQHHEIVPHIKHPDGKGPHNRQLADHQRGSMHPQHHTGGKMPAQMNPDHGPHNHRGGRGR